MNISPINAGISYNKPNFTAAPKLQPSYFSKSNAFFHDTKKALNKGWDNFIDKAIIEPIVVPVMNSKTMGKMADKSANIDNMAAHMSTAGSCVTTAVYANRTLNNENLDKKRAKTLALNQIMVTGVSTFGAYKINKKLDKFSQSLGYKFRVANQGSKNLEKRMQGFNIAKQLLIFAAMYRYVAPVIVTPIASKLGKWIENKQEAKRAAANAPAQQNMPNPAAQPKMTPVKA